MKAPIIIAEACCNHMGNMEIAKEMIIRAQQCGVEFIKFQKRDIDFWAEHSRSIYSSPHPNPERAFGDTYEQHRRALEFSIVQHQELIELCESVGIKYACSVFDINSAKDIIELSPGFIKIPSSCNSNYDLLKYVCRNYQGDIHLSFGMTSRIQIDDIINLFVDENRASSLIIYACTSAYPPPLYETCLLEIKYLINKYSTLVKGIGYSGHHKGIVIDIAAYTLGAEFIERHFTLNRCFKGTDHELSITPEELAVLVANLNDVSKCLEYKQSDILPSEKHSLERLKW